MRKFWLAPLVARYSPSLVRLWQHVERFSNFLNNRSADRHFAGCVTSQQSVIAKIVYVTRNSFRATVDVIDRVGGKDVGALGARNQQARGNVAISFLDAR